MLYSANNVQLTGTVLAVGLGVMIYTKLRFDDIATTVGTSELLLVNT